MQTLYFDHINHNLYATVTFTQEKKTCHSDDN